MSNSNKQPDPSKSSSSSPPSDYLQYLHPDVIGYMTPRGSKCLVESVTNSHGESDGYENSDGKIDKWSGAVGTEFRNAEPVDGTKKWLIENFNKDLMFKRSNADHKQLAHIEQVSLNQFSKIDNGSNGAAENTMGLKNILVDFDSVAEDAISRFKDWLVSTGMPYSFAVFTGSKGVHVVICLDELLPTNSYADRLGNAISEALEGLGAEKWGLDSGPLVGDRKYTSACRLPGLVRQKTNKVQSLVQEWAGTISVQSLEHWLDQKEKNWKKKDYKKSAAKKVSCSFGEEKMTPKARALKEIVEYAQKNDWIYADKFFWVWDGSSYFKKLDWNKEEYKKLLWPIYKRVMGYECSDAQFRDRVEILKNEIRSDMGFNADLINFSNGVLDLKTLTLLSPSKDYRFNYRIPFEYDFDVNSKPDSAPVWESILINHIPQKEDRILLEQFLGYLLTEDRNKKQMLILYGKRDTGKSTILNFLKRLLGPELVTLERIDKVLDDPAHAVNIVGKRVSISSELKFKMKDTESFKALIDFEELSIHIFHQSKSTVPHSCRFISSTNHHAWIPNSEEIRKRIRVVEFDNPVSQDQQDPNMTEKLWDERRAIVHRLLNAYLKVRQAANFGIYTSTLNYMKASAENINHVAPWVHDQNMQIGDHWYPTEFLYEKYRIDTGDDRTTQIDFARKLKDAGILEGKEPREFERFGFKLRRRGRFISLNLDEDFKKWCSRTSF